MLTMKCRPATPFAQRICRTSLLTLLLCLLGGLVLTAQRPRSARAAARYVGVNLASAEFGEGNLPGTYNADYVYPTHAEVDYFVGKGMNTIRLPFRWERLQRAQLAAFDATELARLDDIVNYTTGKGAYLLLDPHNYARYFGQIIGASGSSVPASAFADFWGRLATRYKGNSRVIFGLMNEPMEMQTEVWRADAQAAINAIRSAGATNLILVPGNGWTGAHSWLDSWYGSSNASQMIQISDPANNYAFEVHQYMDADASGTSPSCTSTTVGAEKLAGFTSWLRQNGKRGFLGEFAGGRNSTCYTALDTMLAHIDANADVWLGWTYWAAGPWWGEYDFTIEPNGADRPQMAPLGRHLSGTVPTPPPATASRTSTTGGVATATRTSTSVTAATATRTSTASVPTATTPSGSCTSGTQIQAESYDTALSSGVAIMAGGDGSPDLGAIDAGDWAAYPNITLPAAGCIEYRVASPGGGGTIEARLGSASGTVVSASCAIPATGGWASYITRQCQLAATAGTYTLYLKFGGSSGSFQLNWLKVLAGGTTTPPTATRTSTTASIATATRTATAVSGGTPSGLKAQYKAANTAASSNQISPHFNLVNTGSASVALSELKLRYYYSREGSAPEQFNCDWATLGCANVTGSFAAGYLELGFTPGAGSLAPGAQSGEVQVRFNKTDWTTYTQTGDYSFDPTKTAFADWSRVTLFRNGALVWGTAP
jgi:endoglucanase